MMYKTHAIENLTLQLRKIIQSRGHFPTIEATIGSYGLHCTTY